MAEILRRCLRAAADLLLPAVCPLCRAEGRHLCPACRERLPLLRCPCPQCGTPRYDEHSACNGCGGYGLPHLARVQVVYAYTTTMLRLVTAAKAGRRAGAVGALAALLPVPAATVDAVVAVPPSPERRSGAHLATALAQAAAAHLGKPLLPALRCCRYAHEQHRLTRADRMRNVTDLFAARAAVPPRILLVDDILTSGATASAAAGVLMQAGAVRVEGCFLCRTPRG